MPKYRGPAPVIGRSKAGNPTAIRLEFPAEAAGLPWSCVTDTHDRLKITLFPGFVRVQLNR